MNRTQGCGGDARASATRVEGKQNELTRGTSTRGAGLGTTRRGVDDTQLDDGRWVDGSAVGWDGDERKR